MACRLLLLAHAAFLTACEPLLIAYMYASFDSICASVRGIYVTYGIYGIYDMKRAPNASLTVCRSVSMAYRPLFKGYWPLLMVYKSLLMVYRGR